MVERSVNKPIVAVISGDGIGPEVVEAAIPAIDQAAQLSGVPLEWRRLPFGADHYLKTGETIPEAAVQELAANVDAIFVGALGDPRIPTNEHARDILLGLRFPFVSPEDPRPPGFSFRPISSHTVSPLTSKVGSGSAAPKLSLRSLALW